MAMRNQALPPSMPASVTVMRTPLASQDSFTGLSVWAIAGEKSYKMA